LNNSPWASPPVLPPEPEQDDHFDILVKDNLNKGHFLLACVQYQLAVTNVVDILKSPVQALFHMAFKVDKDTLNLDEEIPDGYFRVLSPEAPLGFDEFPITFPEKKHYGTDISVPDSERGPGKSDDLTASRSEPEKAPE
jgi:hypothetical protein